MSHPDLRSPDLRSRDPADEEFSATPEELWRPAPYLATGRLGLEPLRIFHAFEMVNVLGDKRLYEFTGGEPPNLELLLRRYTMMFAGSRDKNEYWHNWIMRHRESGRAIGHVQATVTGLDVAMAWTTGADWQGQGFATEAAQRVSSWLGHDAAPSLVAWIHPKHLASQRIAASIGLVGSDVVDDDGEECWTSSQLRATGTSGSMPVVVEEP